MGSSNLAMLREVSHSFVFFASLKNMYIFLVCPILGFPLLMEDKPDRILENNSHRFASLENLVADKLNAPSLPSYIVSQSNMALFVLLSISNGLN